ncbi:MAG: FAD:protein FMN transferase [Saprospiraceae bacterium]|nr:FAD:protein FMN transferase [Saprospiraceae bacterium]
MYRWVILMLLVRVANGQSVASPPELRYEFSHPQMGTVFRLVFYSRQDSVEANKTASDVFQYIDSLNAIFSDWLPESELNQLCAMAVNGREVTVSAPLFDILSKSNDFSVRSGGAFDVTIGPLTRLWRRARNLHEMPDSLRIQMAHEKVGWKLLKLDKKTKKVTMLRTGMQLDLGGIAQGWTADRCLEFLKKAGIRRALVDAGGDIAIGDAPPGEKGWAIERPDCKKGTIIHHLRNCGITTSGARYRYTELEGVRYSHIIDPRSGKPLTHQVEATVIAKNATMADAWATAASVLGKSGFVKLRLKPDIRLWLTESPF